MVSPAYKSSSQEAKTADCCKCEKQEAFLLRIVKSCQQNYQGDCVNGSGLECSCSLGRGRSHPPPTPTYSISPLPPATCSSFCWFGRPLSGDSWGDPKWLLTILLKAWDEEAQAQWCWTILSCLAKERDLADTGLSSSVPLGPHLSPFQRPKLEDCHLPALLFWLLFLS